MKAICLGGAGKITREAALDLVQFSDFSRITIADVNKTEGEQVVQWLNDERVDYRFIDVHKESETVKILQDYDIVLDGTTISLNEQTTACIAKAGCHGLNLNGFGKEYQFDDQFKMNKRIFIPGFGMTPGTTNMMAKSVIDTMSEIISIRVSHGAFRPIAFSESISETTVYEYDPLLTDRVVYEDGEFIQVPPFARPRDIELPEPYGTHTQYIIPHSETITLAEYLKDKKVGLIEVRGTWPPKNMQLLRALYDWGFMQNTPISVNGENIGIMDAISNYLKNSEFGRNTELYGYALHVEVVGKRNGSTFEHTLIHTHPASDGSVQGWENLRAYTRCVAIPFSIAAQLIAQDKVSGTGVVIPERALEPEHIFSELEKREIHIHKKHREMK